MKKKLIAGALLAAAAVSLTACGSAGAPVEEIPNQEIVQSSQVQQELDLSMYDAHGPWSDGLMWVHKTESSYDAVNGYYGYIDRSGTVVTGWHSDQDWLQPSDFVNGYSTVCVGIDYGINYSVVSYAIIDSTGAERVLFYTHSGHTMDPQKKYKKFMEDNYGDWVTFNENGLLFYTEKTEHLNDYPKPVSYVRIADDGGLTGTKVKRSEKMNVYPECFADDFENGYILYYDATYYTPHSTEYMRIFYMDIGGNTALDLSNFEYPILECGPIINGTVEIIFRGMDSEKYRLKLDLDGNWLTEPEKVIA